MIRPGRTDAMIAMTGRRVVVTGAGGGLGRALVARFAEAGAEVVACDVSEAMLKGLPAAGTCVFDLADREATLGAAARIVEGGPPHAVVSNAGCTRAESMAMTGPEEIEAELAVNYTGAALFTRALLDAMEPGSCFVFVASVNAVAHFGNPAYGPAKAALLAWSRALAVEAGARGIRSNAIAPGSVRTPVWDARIAARPGLIGEVSALYPLGRLVTPEEVADTALFLASPMAGGITGATIPVDGGLTAGSLPFLRLIGAAE
jgi:NAD(P)-dependent dehydrogenase (short-subunit alcohol dehydrogenase family)